MKLMPYVRLATQGTETALFFKIFNCQRTQKARKNKKASLYLRGFSTEFCFVSCGYSKAESPAREPPTVPFVAFAFTVAIKYIFSFTYNLWVAKHPYCRSAFFPQASSIGCQRHYALSSAPFSLPEVSKHRSFTYCYTTLIPQNPFLSRRFFIFFAQTLIDANVPNASD